MAERVPDSLLGLAPPTVAGISAWNRAAAKKVRSKVLRDSLKTAVADPSPHFKFSPADTAAGREAAMYYQTKFGIDASQIRDQP